MNDGAPQDSPGGSPRADYLLRELRSTARSGDPAERARLREQVAELPRDEKTAASIREHLAIVGQRLERLDAETSKPAESSREILALRGDLSWLPLVFPEEPREETLRALQAELETATTVALALAAEGEPGPEEDLERRKEDLRAVKEELLRTTVDALLAEPSPDPDELWHRYLEARDLGIDELAGKVRTRLAERIGETETAAAARSLGHCAAEYEDRALDLLAGQAELPPAEAAEHLGKGRRELQWLRVLIRGTVRRAAKEEGKSGRDVRRLKRWMRRLGRASRRLTREAQEVRLQARLEGIFGARFVAFFENLILWLILAVLGIIVVDAILPDPESFESHLDIVHQAVFSPDGRLILTASEDHTAQLWEESSGDRLEVLSGHAGPIEHAAFSPSGRRALTASDDRTARLWDLKTAMVIRELRGHDSAVRSAEFSPDGTLAATASSDGTARIWDLSTGKELRRFEGHMGPVYVARFSVDGTRLLTASADGTARVWDAADGTELYRLSGHRGPVHDARFAADGRHVLTASEDKTARIWSLRSGAAIRIFEGHHGAVYQAVYSPSGDRVLTACEDHAARIWDVKTGNRLMLLEGHAAPVRSAVFSADGSLVLTASDDGSARLWDPKTGREVRRRAHWLRLKLVLFWIDAAICAVFLLEFFVKLALVKGKVSWFARHFLVDFLPSIPFGLIGLLTHESLRAGKMTPDRTRVLRALRLFRLARVFRYVRIARPITRFLRFFGFLQRGVDRFVRLHGSLMNRNIVLFEAAPTGTELDEEADLVERLRQVRRQAREAWRRRAGVLVPAVRAERLREFLDGLPAGDRLLALPAAAGTTEQQGITLVRAEDLVDKLTRLDPGSVEAGIGSAGAGRFALTLERLDVPLLRRIPPLNRMVPAAREGEPLEQVAAAGRALGRWLQKLLAMVHWLSDLSGVITGPQFLDRVGTTMAQASARPAKRLLIFGFGFLVFRGLVDFLGIDFLGGLANWLGKTLGAPFLILGAFALGTFLVGLWFRRVAGEATDFYARTAEAQYINLLKSVKLAHVSEDLALLWEHAIRPEEILRPDAAADGGPELLEEMLTRGAVSSSTSALHDRVLQLYRDYLDGAIFHISDTKTTSQLLGNLALENIRLERLGTTKRERKRLADLDLERSHPAFRGPYLWFKSITHSVAQRTAKRILEYNRRAIPLADRPNYPPETLRNLDRWLDEKIAGTVAETTDGPATAFLTTEFTALHFLTVDEERDRAVAERFGEKTLEALTADRRAMIRVILGTYPFHRLPRPDRTLNPFDLYNRFLAGGRVLLLPFYLFRMLLFVSGWMIRRIRVTLREISEPAVSGRGGKDSWASYDVAVRKINRMRKPLFMECARFRAMFDPEYLGLAILPDESTGLEGRTYREDLERIGARDEEWDAFTEIREARDEALHELAAMAAAAGGPEEFVRGLGTKARWREAYRAVGIAYAIDYRNARSFASLTERTREVLGEVIEAKGQGVGATALRRLTWLLIPARSLKTAFAGFSARFLPEGTGPRELRWIWRAVRADYRGLRRMVTLGAALDPGMAPKEAGRRVLEEVARHPETWSEQLVTLRTVQSLSSIDVRNYRRQVWELGGYGNG